MSLNQVKNIQDGEETFELWSNADGSDWEIRLPESSPSGQFASGGQILHDTSQRTVVKNNSYVNNYNNSTLSTNAKNDAFETINSKFVNASNNDALWDGLINSETPPGFGEDTSFASWRKSEEFKKLREEDSSFEFPEFGKVDKILQQLSLRNLKYPVDADYGNTQDYIQINQFSYKSPTEGIFFPKAKGIKGEDGYKSARKVGFEQGIRAAGLGVSPGTPKEKAIGLVKLPMPNSLADSNNVSWGPDQLNALTAAATSAVMGTSNTALDGIINFLANSKGKDFGELISSGLSGAGGFIKNTVTDLGETINSVPGGAAGAMKNENINLLGKTVLGSALLNLIGFQVSPESILARGAGVIPNNNLALLFNSPTLREFTFSWKMSPRSRDEAIRVNNILRFFKQGMAPKKSDGSASGGASYFLGTPNVFDIHFKTAKTKDYQILDRNDSVLRIKTCACTGAAVNYTPEGMRNAYEKGQPVAITLTLRFNELEPIFDTDYDNNYFNYDPQRTDLLPVPTDAVGY